MLRNSQTQFGTLSKLLHWVIALLVIGLIGLGLYLENVKIHYTQLYLYGWHKSAGILAFTLICLRLIWHFWSTPPAPLGGGWQRVAAKSAHRVLYVLMIIVPLSGWIASSASGFEMTFFGLFPIPFIAPVSETTEERFFAIHGISTKLLIAVIGLHVGAAFYRHWGKKDRTLMRMWFQSSKG